MSNIISNLIFVLEKYSHLFVSGTIVTLQYSVVAVFGGVLFGALLAMMRRSTLHIGKFRPVSALATIYVEIIRGTPILLQLYVFYFWVSTIVPFEMTKFQSISIALIFNSAAYVAEIFRAGIEAVDKGQTEAARSLGLSSGQTMLRIVMPQAIKNILPALCNEFIMMIKETSLASTFFGGDIMSQQKTISGASSLVIEPMIVSAVIYFVLTFTLSKVVAVFERRMSTGD